ncbi:MAG: hypothetical protein J6A54_01820, partial [Clostridia bacterium]|nr:hypothetical protein [Clostridia bacterium]
YDYNALMSELFALSKENEIIKLSYIGNTIMSRPIPMITIGEHTAKKSVMYVGTHHALENICTSVLLRFIREYAISYQKRDRVCGINMETLYKMRKIYIIPMLNPDGVEYRLNGIDEQSPIYNRIMKITDGSFEKWSSNARGVDLNHNYDAGFYEYKKLECELGIEEGATKYSGESPESEPEVSALTNLIRYNQDELEGILTLHTQGEEIYYKSQGTCPKKSDFLARMISKMTGYKLAEADGTASYGGLTDWFIKEFDKPSFTLECGKGENPLPISSASSIYLRLRELFFTFPILF